PWTCSSIHVRSISSCSGLWATAPRTPKPPALVTAATTSRQWLKARIGNSTPSISDTRVCMTANLCRPQLADACGDVIGCAPVRVEHEIGALDVEGSDVAHDLAEVGVVGAEQVVAGEPDVLVVAAAPSPLEQ